MTIIQSTSGCQKLFSPYQFKIYYNLTKKKNTHTDISNNFTIQIKDLSVIRLPVSFFVLVPLVLRNWFNIFTDDHNVVFTFFFLLNFGCCYCCDGWSRTLEQIKNQNPMRFPFFYKTNRKEQLHEMHLNLFQLSTYFLVLKILSLKIFPFKYL